MSDNRGGGICVCLHGYSTGWYVYQSQSGSVCLSLYPKTASDNLHRYRCWGDFLSTCHWFSMSVCWKEVVSLPVSHRGAWRPLWRDKHLEQNESHSPSQPLIPWVRLVSCRERHTHTNFKHAHVLRLHHPVKNSFWFDLVHCCKTYTQFVYANFLQHVREY